MDTESFVLDVVDVIKETADAHTIVLARPAEGAEKFDYKPGQFLTVGVPSDQTGLAARAYSLCSAPADTELAITVKRTVDGYASNWICDNLRAGDTLRVQPPSGIFTPKSLDDDLLLFGGGSGITPVMSILRTALAEGTGKIVLFYANRDEKSVIFADQLRELAVQYPERLLVVHWLETVQGLPTQEILREFARPYMDTYHSLCCGPGPYMKAVSNALRELDVPRERRQQEKFVSLGGNPFGDVEEVRAFEAQLAEAEAPDDAPGDAGEGAVVGPVALEVELDGQQYEFNDWDGRTLLLDFLEAKGVPAPFSCREGQCSACACVVLEGDLSMKHNEVLDKDDLADGIRLSCQGQALTEKLRISYNG